MTNRKISFFFIAVICLSFISGLLWHHSHQPEEIKPILINQPVPEFVLPTLFDLEETTNSDDFIGHVTILTIWTSPCSDCKEAHRLFERLAEKEALEIYGINTKNTRDVAQQWLQENGNPYDRIALDEDGTVSAAWGARDFPTTLIIDKKGVIRYRYTGSITIETWEKILDPLVTQLNNETL